MKRLLQALADLIPDPTFAAVTLAWLLFGWGSWGLLWLAVKLGWFGPQ
jgi:hypothetical protein